jgi:hypothetical protein
MAKKPKFKVGDKVRMTKECQKMCFIRGTEFTWGVVTKVYPDLERIGVKRYYTGVGTLKGKEWNYSLNLPYRGHELTTWHENRWKK